MKIYLSKQAKNPHGFNLSFSRLRPLRQGLSIVLLLLGINIPTFAQTTETLSSGAFVINMGVTPPTANNALKPYGLLYEILKNNSGPIKWVISPTKLKDGVDFTYNGVEYRGGTFIIPAEARTASVNAAITSWQGQGVVGITTTSPITVPVYTTLTFVPRWTLDKKNGAIAVDFFANAGIPATAHGGSIPSGWVDPQALDCCTDLFVMPHADPTWATHSRLFSWNLECKGAIWLGCHAGSALENMFNPASPSEQTNFLAEKTGTATGAGPYSASNALVLWGSHTAGTPPYTYDYSTDPVMQFIGQLDAATQNGSEQIYIPTTAGWRPTTKVGIYDPDHPQKPAAHRAAILAWGKGLGDPNRGLVMLEASHDIAQLTDIPNIAAMRAFLNFSLIALAEKSVVPVIAGLPSTNTTTIVSAGTSIPLSVSVPAPALMSNYTITWASSCGGTFTPSTSAASVTFKAPSTVGKCHITVVIKDACGRETFDCRYIEVSACKLTVASTFKQPCGAASNGAINMTVTGGTAPYSYTWTRTGGGTGSGAGTNITGLAAGTYSVVITDSQSCSVTCTCVLDQSPAINITATPVAVVCAGGSTGAINLTVTGGVPAYTYNWGGGITTKNRSALVAGTYNVTVTDANTCTATASATVTAPAAMVITPTLTQVACFGESTGAISIAVTGGTGTKTYAWSNGATTQNLTGLAAGTYTVTVKDANGCTKTSSSTITQPATGMTLTNTAINYACTTAKGSIDLTVNGGTSPYTYLWSNAATTQDITGLNAGNYSVTVTDSKGCTATLSKTITQVPAFALSAVLVNSTCPTPGTGSITLSVSGGSSPFSYLWADGPSTQNRTALVPGSYSVTVTDAAGCTATIAATVTALQGLPQTPTVVNH